MNEKISAENLHLESLVAERFVIDYMKSSQYQPYDTTFTKQLMGSVKQSNLSFTEVLNEKQIC